MQDSIILSHQLLGEVLDHPSRGCAPATGHYTAEGLFYYCAKRYLRQRKLKLGELAAAE